MSVFGNYARYYDLLYRDKDYGGEANFISKLLQAHAPEARSILELGCGTGMHATLLAQKGYEVCGVDMSAQMLEGAKQRVQALPAQLASKLQFHQGDIRSFRLSQQFDAVISLFHVISYQTTNEDLRSAFATAKTHLKPGGAFIFDCWYGPAVLTEPPAVRVKRLQDAEIAVTRIAEPVMYANDNLVDVNYQVFIKNLEDGTIEPIEETHRMRYLFKPELETFLSGAGLELIGCGEWMTDKDPGFNTWGVYFVGRAS